MTDEDLNRAAAVEIMEWERASETPRAYWMSKNPSGAHTIPVMLVHEFDPQHRIEHAMLLWGKLEEADYKMVLYSPHPTLWNTWTCRILPKDKYRDPFEAKADTSSEAITRGTLAAKRAES